MASKHNQYGLQLSGGGGRAAYQVGVLKAIASFYPRNHGLPFPILCGTSAGAINAATLACFASCFHLGVRKLEWVWENFSTHQVYRADSLGMAKHFGHLALGRRLAGRPPSLFDNRPLRALLERVLPLERLDRHIQGGYLRAITLSVSRYHDPCSVNFYQGDPSLLPWQRFRRRGEPTQLSIDHLMASSAIPLIFPSVRLGDDHYGDGSVLQLSPLSPPIHLGASRLLVVNLDSPHGRQTMAQRHRAPATSEIAGHLLDTVFSDTLNSDLERLERINRSLSLIPPDQRQSQPLKPIETLVIKPSRDLDEIARRHYRALPTPVRLLLRTIGVQKDSDSSLLSYLMFEAPYCCELIELGYHDALARKGELKYFFDL
ncbi:patatin-like phospholipase family protein [Ferrimonas balearica]|uniref:patatin-like phospholipase family protein n=1 Tax=Ferrimonas balearica TaxID=44012 RepID=UPI001F42DB61|nr:patatin-like phospholipase family protein [Ferrimonas balearica]MBY6018176.1 patatin-like phospholipase family protein [Halomonas denitrificans]MBY6094516.1 patatin-like phospholipase family protein [Ferrimonas balearica]